jgi:adenylate cyclase
MRTTTSIASQLHERLGRRLIEGYVVFTFVPAIVLLLTLRRIVSELGGLHRYVLEATVLAAGFTLPALGTALAFGRSLRKDSEKLLEAVRKLGEGNFEPRVSTSRQVELGGSKRDVVILFSDLRGFTRLSESLPPERLISVLNGYFTEMVEAIRSNGGMVDNFIGDAVLAVFGLIDGSSGDNPAVSAVRATIEMQERLAEYNEKLAVDGIALKSGIGIHAGEVVAGYLGSVQPMEFTVVGHNVNVAARIESHAKPPQPPLLVSDEVAKRIASVFEMECVGTAALKGVGDEMKLFTVKKAHPGETSTK